ncbi:MAG: prepilin peptidase [bacterium]
MQHLSVQETILVFLIFYIPALLAFVFGSIIGSLSNVIIYRMVYYRSIWSPSSHCTSCGIEIPWYLNVPIISYLVLRGRCRFCGARFTSRYFWVELITGLLYAFAILWIYTLPAPEGFGLSFRTVMTFQFKEMPPLGGFYLEPLATVLMLKSFIFISFLIILTMIDLEHQLLPDRITIPGIILGLLLCFAAPLNRPALASFGTHGWPDALLQSVLGLIVGGGILWLIAAIKPGGMGMGDVKLNAMIGAFIGIKALAPAMFLGFVIGGLTSVLLIIFKKAGRKTLIPFGPFLALGGLIGFFWGHHLWVWYIAHSIGSSAGKFPGEP